jgi:HD-GYP domain-containing protein (c-di-GMP phosphodiesterase class II)
MTTTGPTARSRRLDPVLVVIATSCLLAIGVGFLAWWLTSLSRNWVALGVLTLLGVGSWAVGVPARRGDVVSSFLHIVLLAAIVIVGPLGAGIVAVAAYAGERAKMPVRAYVFNSSMWFTMTVSAGLAYKAVGGAGATAMVHLDGVLPLLLLVGFPLIVADVVQALVNAALLAAIVSASQRVPAVPFAVGLLRTSGPAYIGYGVVGFLLAVLWLPAGLGPVAALLIAAPLFVARWVLVQYEEEVRTHERTVNALVAALEAKDPTCMGHGERVCLLAGWIADDLGFPTPQKASLEQAARLHDIGRLVLPPHVLWPIEPPTGEDLEALEGHAEAGERLLDGIDFLAGAAEGIRHHHEHFDGTGHPGGLAGDRIPLAARVIAVADAFDAVTANGFVPDRLTVADALALLADRAGSHLDPVVVESLTRVLDGRNWPPEGTEVPADLGRFVAHDDPRFASAPPRQRQDTGSEALLSGEDRR